jgi:rhamnosyltransferase
MQSAAINIVNLPKVAVCLAAYNGLTHLSQQIETILSQIKVDVTLYISVDKSSDGTENLVDQFTKSNCRIIGLSHGEILGSAASNFFRMLIEIDFSNFDYVSFADQDDIWNIDKLIRHIEIAKNNKADGVSSNVMAFWLDGRKRLINKAQAQKSFDYLFESAGPGCTFLMTPWLVNKVLDELMDDSSPAKDIALHDWLSYAVCRANGRKWVIDFVPSVQYRQHEHNVLGANVGLKAKLARLSKLRQGWYRSEVSKVVEVCNRIQPKPEVLKIATLLKSKKISARIQLLTYIPQARRSLADRLLLGICIVLGLF